MPQQDTSPQATVTITIPARGAFTYTPEPTLLEVVDHAIVPFVVLILVIFFMVKFSKAISENLIPRIGSLEALGLAKLTAQPPKVGDTSEGAFIAEGIDAAPRQTSLPP